MAGHAQLKFVMTECSKTQIRLTRPKYGLFWHSRASNSEVNGPIWPEFEHIPDCIAVLVTCKFEDDSIKNEGAIFCTTFSPLQVHGKIFHCSRANNSKANIPIRPKIDLVQDYMTVLITCKFDEDRIKIEVAILRTTFVPL